MDTVKPVDWIAGYVHGSTKEGGAFFVLFGKALALLRTFECMSTSPIYHACFHACLHMSMMSIAGWAGVWAAKCEDSLPCVPTPALSC